MKIVTIVGARPQFIKSAVVSRLLDNVCEEILVHTGQHYDYNMSEIFFDELNIKKPKYNLGISGGSHGKMTARMLDSIEKILIDEKPEKVLVYGDTNSTLAAALAAVKLHIPIYHVEAGNRFGTLDSPEEVNRIVTDHISSCLMPCTESARKFLEIEGLKNKTTLVGDPMFDAFLYYRNYVNDKHKKKLFDFDGNMIEKPSMYYYLTCHRQENTNNISTIFEILRTMNNLEHPTIYPVHPRNQHDIKEICKSNSFDNIRLIQPVGYLTSISLIDDAYKVVTDSGGLQREAFFAEKQCITILDFIVWPETMVGNRNQLAKPDMNDILNKLNKSQTVDDNYQPFGDGHASEKIVKLLLEREN